VPHEPIRTTVVGSYPFPGWLELLAEHGDEVGSDDREEAIRDAVTAAIADQVRAGIDVITDGEQTRFDFNLSFYAFLDGLELERVPRRRLGPPAHDQRGLHRIVGELRAPRGLGVVEEFERLRELAPADARLKASVPGPYTLAGRIEPSGDYPDRYAVTEALVPIVRDELTRLVDVGCENVTVDEPSMSCYAWREDVARLVDIFNRTVEPVVGKTYLGTHLCFGNFKARAAAPRRYAPMFPAFLELDVDELHLEMASRGRRCRHRRREELVRRVGGRRRRADRRLPALRRSRAALGLTGLRAFPDGTLGRPRQARGAGRGCAARTRLALAVHAFHRASNAKARAGFATKICSESSTPSSRSSRGLNRANT